MSRMRMSFGVGCQNRLEPIQMPSERHLARDSDGPGSHRVQLVGTTKRSDQPVGERGCSRRVRGDEIAVLARPQPLTDPAQVKGDRGHAERRRLEPDEPKRLGPGAWNSEQTRLAQPLPALVAFLPSDERASDGQARREPLPDTTLRTVADHREIDPRSKPARGLGDGPNQQVAAFERRHPTEEGYRWGPWRRGNLVEPEVVRGEQRGNMNVLGRRAIARVFAFHVIAGDRDGVIPREQALLFSGPAVLPERAWRG